MDWPSGSPATISYSALDGYLSKYQVQTPGTLQGTRTEGSCVPCSPEGGRENGQHWHLLGHRCSEAVSRGPWWPCAGASSMWFLLRTPVMLTR